MTAIDDIKNILQAVSDPEIPVLSIMDMGIVQTVESRDDGSYLISIIPTYSGCPAMDTIAEDIIAELSKAEIKAEVKQILSPAWTTDMITDKGRKALEDYGIAAPLEADLDKAALKGESNKVQCTNCGSKNTIMISQFGSTPCKALFRCNDCREPFDYFKCFK